ncbi:TPA: phage tail protein [Escherichia coli]|nr:phage tail protein [Escherichia coli]
MIYTTGTIAVSGKTVTGTGTEFNAALSMIRVGCTLIAISNPVQIFSITEVKSATGLSVTPSASPAIPAGTKFSILLSDSISVDGLAQDVAETLRYYQGKESEIADAVEFFSDNKDVISASKLATESATTATNAATTATSAADSAKTYRDEAHEYANQTAKPYAYVLQPLPDVWIPFNDSLDMITGYGPGTKKVTIDGEEKTISSDKVVSFSRASTATYINKSGVLTVADINEPRFEREGLLIEGQRTNYLLNSNNPQSWPIHTSLNKDFGSDNFNFNYATVSPTNDIIGITGGYAIINVATRDRFNLPKGESFTFSCRAKGSKCRLRARVAYAGDDGADVFSADAYLDFDSVTASVSGQTNLIRSKVEQRGEWLYFEVTYTADADRNAINCAFFFVNKTSEEPFYEDSTITLATPQIELGSCASSFIISNGTPTTRASDIATAPIKNNLYNAPFTILCEVHKNWKYTPSAAPRVFDTGGHQTGEAIILAFGASGEYDGFPYYDIGGANRRVNENASLQKMIIGMRVKSTYDTCCVSNGMLSSETKTTWMSIINTAIFRFGGQTTTGEQHLFGHIRNFRVWHKALTDAQLSEIV